MTALLTVTSLHAGYGDVRVLRDVSLQVDEGEIVAIVGANGAGKSTLLGAISGLLQPTSGAVVFRGADITGRAAHRGPASGMALVPEGGRLFPFLTVEDNLLLGSYGAGDKAGRLRRLEGVMSTFPVLRERRAQLAGKLSGGERQMCAVARAMMSGPSFLMLDEPSVGLSPLMVERILSVVQDLVARTGLTVLLVEQNTVEALDIADRAYVLDHGEMLLEGPAKQLAADPRVQQAYMGL
jgi:branched-chain amino acid transport system ATP-binding protein